MLKRYQNIFSELFRATDAAVVVGAWLASYWARFHLAPYEVTTDLPPFGTYASLAPLVAILWMGVFTFMGVYESGRLRSRRAEAVLIGKAHIVALLVFVAVTYLYDTYKYSRLVMVYFGALAAILLTAFRIIVRSTLRGLRARGYNLRYVLVVGKGPSARALVERLESYPELGLRVRGVLTRTGTLANSDVDIDAPVLGSYTDLSKVLSEHAVDEVLLALPRDEQDELSRILAEIQDETVDIRVVPDVQDYVTFGCHIEQFDGFPIVRLNDSPMSGWGALLKRATDVGVSAILLVLLSPLLLCIAAAVKLTSPGPVLYNQERMGLDGRSFKMWKFRSMRCDAESTSGAVWARADDDRRTRLGTFLRATSLDELPQLWNVLVGDMSLVGPRPERPVFVQQFRHEIAHYMLRHKVKAGITGWAQVNGWRGNTSLTRRIECDLYYIRHWSLALDLKILTMTLWKGFVNKNAY